MPAPPLDRFIDDIYCLSGSPRYRRVNVPPMPSAHLLLNLGGPVRLTDSDPSVPSAVFADGWFMGVWTRRFVLEYPSWVQVVGVHFKPWGVAPFVDVPATALRNRWVPVGVTPKRVARIYRFARLILSVDARRPVNWADLALSAGYSDQAHFSREFKDFTGHTPTEYLALRRRSPAQEGFPPDQGPMPAD